MASEKIRYGVIVDNRDPLYQARAKVKIFGLFDGIDEEDIPWATQSGGIIFAGANGTGTISIPRIGTVVGVDWDGDNYYNIYYTFIDAYSEEMIAEIKKSYEGSHVLLFDTESTPGPLKIMYTQQKGMVFELGDAKIQLDTQDGGELRIVLKMGDDEIRMEKKKVIINSKNIELGENAVESVIKGNAFKKIYDTHTHPSSGAPPVIPLPPGVLSKNTKTK